MATSIPEDDDVEMSAEAPSSSMFSSHLFEVRYCVFFAVYGLIRKVENFKLRYKVNPEESGKLGVIWFYDGHKTYCIQMKNKMRKITGSDLFRNRYNEPFNLLKYVDSVKNNIKLDNYKAILLTDTSFDIDNENKIKLKKCNSMAKKWIGEISELQLDPVDLLDECFTLFKLHCPDMKEYKFKDKNIVKSLQRQAQAESNKRKRKYEYLKETDIEQALECLTYVVGAPNYLQIEEIIKFELKNHFHLQNADNLYYSLQCLFMNWCSDKVKIHADQNNNQIIEYTDIHTVIQNNVKNISFDAIPPTSSFTGRKEQLEAIREILKVNSNLVISQTVACSGLGGIGKTSLVKKFIQLYGKTDFYGRLIWIQAESNETVANSFKNLAKVMDHQYNTNISNESSINVVIKLVFDFFEGVKVLFVFDNYDNYPETDRKENLVVYCRDMASNPNKIDRPYFIYTSRNRECLPKRRPKEAVICLHVLTEEEACKLIKDGLENQNVKDEDVKALAKLLQYFPLALQQAVAFIEYELKARQAAGMNNYELTEYIDLFNKKSEDALKFNEFDGFEKTTFITFDAIKKDKKHGELAIEILQYMSYLYADRIDAKIFSSLNNDDNQVEKALLLLSKYSMITGENKEGKTVYQIHRLVQKVIQLQYKNKEMVEKVWKLIDPKVYEYCKDKTANEMRLYDFDECDSDIYLHYLSILPLVEENHDLHKKIEKCVDYYNGTHIERAFVNNDEETLAEIPKQILIKFAERNIDYYIKEHKNTAAERLLGYVDKEKYNLYFKASLEYGNIEMFKILKDKGGNLNELDLESTVRDVIRGKSDSIKVLLDQERSESNKQILQKCLFFASGFNHKEIVELLIDTNVGINFELRDINWAPIYAAMQLNCYEILKILLKYFDNESKETLENFIIHIFLNDWDTGCVEYQTDKNSLQIIVEKYLEIVDDINYKIRTPSNDDDSDDDDGCLLLFLVTDISFFLPEYENVVIFLLEKGANPLIVENNKRSALFNLLVITKKYGCLKVAYEKKKSEISDEEFSNMCREYLFYEIHEGSINEEFFIVLEEIEDKNVRNENGETLLITYLKNRRFRNADKDEIENMIKAGIDIDAKDNNGKNALYYSLDVLNDEPYKTILKYFQEIDDELPNYYIKSLFKAAQNGEIRTTFYTILDKISDKNVRNENGETLLITYLKNRSSKEAYDDFAEKLIKAGVDVDAKDNNGKNALYYSLDVLNDEPYKTILKYSQEIDDELPNYYIKSLFKAAQHGKVGKTFFTILGKISDKNVRNENGETLLITYLKNRRFRNADKDEIENMIKAGIDVDAKDNNGKNALYYSLKNAKVHETVLKYIN